MDGQRQRSNGGRRRRRKPRMDQGAASEPILIVARRPNSPLIGAQHRTGKSHAAPDSRRNFTPRPSHPGYVTSAAERAPTPVPPAPAPRRSARIVQVARNDSDEREQLRVRLLSRLMGCEGRGAVSRAANEYREAGFDFPREQEVQLQLLEHFDEERARDAIAVLAELLEDQAPIKKPVFEQRLRRLEEYADEPATRAAAARLRRGIRA